MHGLCHVGRVVLCLLPPAMPSRLKSLSLRPANEGCWGQCNQGFQTTWGRLTVMLKNTPFLLLSRVPDVSALCVFPAGLKRQHRTSTSQSAWAKERRLPRCSAPKGQHNVTFDLFLCAHTKKWQRSLECIYLFFAYSSRCYWSIIIPKCRSCLCSKNGIITRIFFFLNTGIQKHLSNQKICF